MHHMDIDESYGERAWRQLHENSTSYTEQILEATKQHLYGHYLPPLELSKVEEQDMRNTVGKVRTKS